MPSSSSSTPWSLSAEPAKQGNKLALGNHARQRCDRKLARFKKLLERRLVQRSSVLLNGAARQQFVGIQAAFGKALPELCQQNIAAGILQIDFVDIDERRDVIARKQAPQGFGVPLHAVVGAHNHNRVVQRAQRALRLGRKIDMPRRIHEHDVGIAMIEYGLRREDRNAALALDRVSVQMRIAIVHAAALADATRVEQHGFGQRGLAGIDMRHRFQRPLASTWLSSYYEPIACGNGRSRSTLDDTIYEPAGEAGPIPRPSSSPRVAARRFS